MTALIDIRLRDLEWTDLAHLACLEQELFGGDAWSEPTWWAELAGRPRRDYVVALDAAGLVLGYAGLDVAGETADVMTIAATTTARGMGVGRALLAELVRRAGDHGAVALLLEVRADNSSALRLYKAAGFEQIRLRRRYYQPEGVDALVLRLILPHRADHAPRRSSTDG